MSHGRTRYLEATTVFDHPLTGAASTLSRQRGLGIYYEQRQSIVRRERIQPSPRA
jgi:hypothetical protein